MLVFVKLLRTAFSVSALLSLTACLRFVLQLLDDFKDLSEKEKLFFKLWSRFIQSIKTTVHIKDLPRYCIQFVNDYAEDLNKHNLEEQWTWHLTNLWDEGHISRSH